MFCVSVEYNITRTTDGPSTSLGDSEEGPKKRGGKIEGEKKKKEEFSDHFHPFLRCPIHLAHRVTRGRSPLYAQTYRISFKNMNYKR